MPLSPTTSHGVGSGAVTPVDGWIDDTLQSWVFASATTFTIASADLTTTFTPGTRLKLTQTTVKYFTVVSSAFAVNTTVTLTGGSDYTLANAAISQNYHSYVANPQGYPGWFTYDCAPTGFSGTPTQRSSRFAIQGRVCHVYIDVLGTSNATTFTVAMPVTYVRSFEAYAAQGTDNGLSQAAPYLAGFRTAPTTTVDIFKSWQAGTFTGSGAKSCQFSASFEF